MANADTIRTRKARFAALAKVGGCTFCGSRLCVWNKKALAKKAKKSKERK